MFNDPRLGLRPNEARSDDLLTRVALRILDDALAGDGDRVLSVPAVGIPVRAPAIRQGAEVIHLLNPPLSTLSDVVLNRGKITPQTWPMRRNTWRARTMTLSGWQAGDLPFSRVLEGPLAIGTQQAINLLDNQQTFSWITPFHRSWVVTTNTTARARRASIAACIRLMAGPAPCACGTTAGSRCTTMTGGRCACWTAWTPSCQSRRPTGRFWR